MDLKNFMEDYMFLHDLGSYFLPVMCHFAVDKRVLHPAISGNQVALSFLLINRLASMPICIQQLKHTS